MIKELFYDWGGANVWLFHAINNVRGEYFDRFMLLGTEIGGHGFFPHYLAVAFIFALVMVGRALRQDRHLGERIGLVWSASLAVFSLGFVADGAFLMWIKPFLDFPRPPLALAGGSLHILVKPEFHHSLPSGHASFAMLVGTSFWMVAGTAGRFLLAAFVLWVGVSRVSVGVHFPADVLASWLTALPIVLLVRTIIMRCFPAMTLNTYPQVAESNCVTGSQSLDQGKSA